MSQPRRSRSISPQHSKPSRIPIRRTSVSLIRSDELVEIASLIQSFPGIRHSISIHSDLVRNLSTPQRPYNNTPDPSFNRPRRIYENSSLGVDSITLSSDTIQLSGVVRRDPLDHMANFTLSDFHKAIPEYSGDVKDTEKFIGCCDHYHSVLNDDTKPAMMGFISTKLSGVAYAFYREHSSETWEVFRESLKTHFSEKKTLAHLQNELQCALQGKKDVKKFVDEIESLLHRMNSVSLRESNGNEEVEAHIRASNDKSACVAFSEGLNEPIRSYIKSRDFTNFYSAADKALQEETSVKNRNRFTISESSEKPAASVPMAPPPIAPAHASSAAVQGASNFMTTGIEREPRSSTHEIVCHYCHKRGHIKSQCNALSRELSLLHLRSYNIPRFNQNTNMVRPFRRPLQEVNTYPRRSGWQNNFNNFRPWNQGPNFNKNPFFNRSPVFGRAQNIRTPPPPPYNSPRSFEDQPRNYNGNNRNSGFNPDYRNYRSRQFSESSGNSRPAFNPGQLNNSFNSRASSYSNASQYRSLDSDRFPNQNNNQRSNTPTRSENGNYSRNNYGSARKNN